MNRELSISLDLVRVIAACTVFLAHFSRLGYTGTYTGFFSEFGHAGVVMFFVLSGYVIAFVCEHKHRDFGCYIRARFARLYSVLLFALLLTFVLDTTGRNLDPSVYTGIPDSPPLAGALLVIMFVQQISFISFKYLSNGPLWSLSYEFWYYIIFGCFYYLTGVKRNVCLLVLFLLVWPKILLLMPCWLAGVIVYQLHKGNTEKSPKYTLLAMGSFAMFWYIASQGKFISWLSHLPGNFGIDPSSLAFSKHFLSDYLLAATFSLTIYSLRYATGTRILTGKYISKAIRTCAGCSFSLYSYHVPFILFLSASGIFNTGSAGSSLLMMCTVLYSIYLLSLVTEAKVKQLRIFLEKLARLSIRPGIQT